MKGKTPITQNLEITGVFGAVLVSLLWGMNVTAIKVALRTFPPFWSAYWRFLGGVFTIGLWALVRGVPLRPLRSEWAPLTVLGILITLQTATVYLGLNFTSAAYSAVLLNSYPIPTSLMAHFFSQGDRLSWPRVVGLTVAFSGISILLLGKPNPELASQPLIGNAICVTASFLFAARFVFTKRIVESIHPIRVVFWQSIFTLPFYLASAALMEEPTRGPITVASVLSILYQGVINSGFCMILWVFLVRRYRPGTLSVFGFLTPISGVAISAIVFSEKLSSSLAVGVITVTAGIILVTKNFTRPITEPPQ